MKFKKFKTILKKILIWMHPVIIVSIIDTFIYKVDFTSCYIGIGLLGIAILVEKKFNKRK
jgi:hypothetical protein